MSTSKQSPENQVPATLVDVAAQARVSTATVSRCLNNPDKVGAATRERVLAAINELGYAPNFGAQAMAARRTKTVGAIIPTMENAIFARAIQAFQEELNESGFTLLVASTGYQPKVEAELIRTLVARGADALLLIGHDREKSVYEFLQKRSIPVVVAWVNGEDGFPLAVGFDNEAAMFQLADRAIKLGHQKVGMISAPQDGNDRARGRIDGVRRAMKSNALDASKLQLIETPYSITNGANALQSLCAGDQRPTLVLCGNDVLAVGALRAAKSLGLRVAEDISITGFDDIELAQISEPSLTTVHVPHRRMGQLAATHILAMIQGAELPPPIAVATEIRWRDSLAPPAT